MRTCADFYERNDRSRCRVLALASAGNYNSVTTNRDFFLLELFVENFLDSPGDSGVRFVQIFDGELDLLAGVQRRPQSGDGEESVEADLLVGGRLHALQSGELGQELLVEAEHRLVVALLAHLIAESNETSEPQDVETVDSSYYGMSNFGDFLPCLHAYGSTFLTFFFFFLGSSSETIILADQITKTRTI